MCIRDSVHRDYITATETAASIATFPGATVRSEMNLESEGISLLSINTEVALTGYDGDWYRVTVYGSDAIGYLHGDSLKIPKKNLIDTSDPVDIVTDTQVRANTNANIRSGPGTNYDRVTTVSAGTCLLYTSFSYVTSFKNPGYILCDFLKIIWCFRKKTKPYFTNRCQTHYDGHIIE